MARKKKKGGFPLKNKALENFNEGYGILHRHPMFSPLLGYCWIIRHENSLCPEDGWAVVTNNGHIHVHPKKLIPPSGWVYVLAHCVLHLGFEHFQKKEYPLEWNTACDCIVAKFLYDMKLAIHPAEVSLEYPGGDEEKLYRRFCDHGIPEKFRYSGTGSMKQGDMIFEKPRLWMPDWEERFASGLERAVTSAINVAAGVESHLGADDRVYTRGKRAKEWFINSYPLLGALAASFDIIEDPLVCASMDISVAAVDEVIKEIYINSAAGLDEYECRFVMAHELLHVGLRHHDRRKGREPYLWNVACDYVINGWLIEINLGEIPVRAAGLYDPELKGLSAEAVYDRIVRDIRTYRKLATLRGVGLCDMLERNNPDWWHSPEGMSLDDFYRRCLSQGLMYHQEQGRGFLPGNLVEEIKSLSYPPISWDVELAQWFDTYFSPLEKFRSYARPSRRQASTPDIPRPRHVPLPGAEDGRTFGVVLDTSGSMDRHLLGKALGAIASYSISRDVPAARVIFCDTLPFDQGYVKPEAIADRVKIKGRGGTILQPGIDILIKAKDFPSDGPLLIITDGECDRLRIPRKHAFLIPEGKSLPFIPKGKVFRIKAR